jgi:hypothetical protein
MKSYGLCLFVLLSASLAVPAQGPVAKESDENLDKKIKALEQQIKVLQDQLEALRAKQARVEICGRLKKLKVANTFALPSPGGSNLVVSSWQVVVNGHSWEVLFPEKDKELLAAAEKLIDKKVFITGTAFFNTDPRGQWNSGYQESYQFFVAVESLQPAPSTAPDDDQKMQKDMKAFQDRIAQLTNKGDDITRREERELLGLKETFEKLSKKLEARENYVAKVQLRGTVVKVGVDTYYNGQRQGKGADVWQIQIRSLPFGQNWKLDFGDKKELEALAKEQKGKRAVITGTIVANSREHPTVNVESLKNAED